MTKAHRNSADDDASEKRIQYSRKRIKLIDHQSERLDTMKQDHDLHPGSTRPYPSPRFPDLRELQSRADHTCKQFTVHTPIRTLLVQAQRAADQANADVTYKRPDRAYMEYLISSEILANVIPKHKDWPILKADSAELGRMYRNLRDQNGKQHAMAREIYDMIRTDNIESGLLQNGKVMMTSMPPSPQNARPLTNGAARPYDSTYRAAPRNDELFLSTATNTHGAHASLQESPQRSRPLSHPNSPAKSSAPFVYDRGHPHQSAAQDSLLDRFSQLRKASVDDTGPLPQYARPTERRRAKRNFDAESSRYSSGDSSPSTSSSGSPGPEFTPKSSVSDSQSMPPPYQPPHPPKIPLQSDQAPSFPAAPKPAYDPSRTSQSAVTRKPIATNGVASTYESKPSEKEKTMSADLSKGPFITADELFDRMKKLNVLVIDVRPREVFDEGHIHAKSVICVEPVILRSGVSAEEIEDRLIVSPPQEVSMFADRNEYDMVVYYDQRTTSDRFLTGPPFEGDEAYPLRLLHDALYEFNYYKPLRRPPLFLLGGVNAWIDVMGTHSLAESHTAAQLGSTRSRTPVRRPGRPLGRVPMASSNSAIEVRKRRMREHHPLSAEEERKWLERTKNEEIESPGFQSMQSDSETDSRRQSTEEPPSPLVFTYEDFLRRFPDIAQGQQSMIAARAPQPPPHRTPLPSMPTIPSRPAPAVPRPSYSGVSDREPTQAVPAFRSPASHPPLYTSRPITRYLKLPRTGLINFGVTCYMNATIQCLAATIPLSQFFLDDKWDGFAQRTNWKGSKGNMLNAFSNLLRSLWSGQFVAVRPSSLRSLCGKLNPEWREEHQQDAKEFLEFILDIMHEDLNVCWERSQLKPLTFEQEMKRERMDVQVASRHEWDRYCHRDSSYITSLFGGQHASRLRCTTCHNTSTTYEPFLSISVEIPRSGKPDLYDCLRSYTREEKLSKDEMWKCPYCKCEREATKQITITRAPQVLVVHFKRFAMGKRDIAKKVHTPINFPLTGLDLGQYMISSKEYPSGERHSNEYSDCATTPPYRYDAFAVMRHLGQTGNGGHYIAIVRDAARGCWRKFDDDKVKDLDPSKLKNSDRLQNEQAYIVFYGRAQAK